MEINVTCKICQASKTVTKVNINLNGGLQIWLDCGHYATFSLRRDK